MEKNLHVTLLKYTPVPVEIVATAARLCYSESDINDLVTHMTDDKCEKLLKKILDMGHESPLEHAYFTFGIEGISRACSHQLVRHRLASYSQQSQRYVEEKDFDYIIPPKIRKHKDLKEKYVQTMEQLGTIYNELRENVSKEDARYVLPNGCETKIIITMNTRSLKNFFLRRMCRRAQWEIRRLANKMLTVCRDVSPLLFENMGPPCVSDKICPEGDMSCGKWKTIPGAGMKSRGESHSCEPV